MKRRLVALDLDGTLVGPEGSITPRTRAAVQAAADRGVAFVIATGRMYRSAVPFARALGLGDVPLIAYNGALVRRLDDGGLIWHKPLPLAVARAAARFCEERGEYVQAYVDDELCVPALVAEALAYSRHAAVPAQPVGAISAWLQRDPTKLLVVAAAERIPDIMAAVNAAFAGQIQTYTSYPIFLELVHPDVSKARALAEVATRLGFDRSEVVAMGDAMNDLSMLTWAGQGVAMAHAPAAVKAAADYVCTVTGGDGVAEALAALIT